MILKDRIYGTFVIQERVITDLLSSKPLRRLKHISQMGPPDRYYHLKNYSRLEHSIGVMLLLRHLKASLEEQIAGLIHDVSHTTFSHVVDWIVGSGEEEDYQDTHHDKSLHQKHISDILRKYSFQPHRIISFKHFPLLEQEIPELCADRIDYALREFPQKIAGECFSHLTTKRGKIVFTDRSGAHLFAVSFLKRQNEHWGGYEAVTRYYYFAQVLKRALKLRVISWDDILGKESYIIRKLERSTDLQIRAILVTLRKKDLSILPKMRRRIKKKFRFVDPLYLENGNIFRLSDTDAVFAELLIQARKENDRGIQPGIISV